jgi:hypothetical protein
MFYAINSKTGETVYAPTLETNPAYEFIREEMWYADTDAIKDAPKELDINKIIVLFREGATDVVNPSGTKYDVSPHFYIPNKTELGINTIPESIEHKLAKNWIYNRLIKPNQDKFLINYSKINKGQHYNQFNLLELPIDKQNIDVECNSSLLKRTRRADIICPFVVRHPILGNGIVFEIQFSKQKDKTRISRELDWAIRGYSIAWLYEDDFKYLSESIIETVKESIDVDSFDNLIKTNKEQHIKELKYTVQEEVRKVKQVVEEMKEEINKEVVINSLITEQQKNYIKELIEHQLIFINSKQRSIIQEEIKNRSKDEIKNIITEEIGKLLLKYKDSLLQPRCPTCESLSKAIITKMGKKMWCCPDGCKEGWMDR